MQKLLFLFIGIIGLLSCGSKKQVTKSPAPARNPLVEKYSTQYGIAITPESNMALYSLIDEWMGVPHRNRGCDKSGTDCSCFVKMVYEQIYQTNVGRSSYEMYDRTARIEKHELEEGDLVFFITSGKSVSHVGIYLANQHFVHVSSSKGVSINSLEEPYYVKTYKGAGKRP